MSAGALSVDNLSGGQRIAVKYFSVAIVLFGAQILFGIVAGLQFVYPNLLYGVLDFSVNRMVHINAMVVWMLYGFIGSAYWLVEEEAGTDLVGLKLANHRGDPAKAAARAVLDGADTIGVIQMQKRDAIGLRLAGVGSRTGGQQHDAKQTEYSIDHY